MTIKPIRNERDHDAAKERLKELILNRGQKSARDEIDVLAALIEKFERETVLNRSPTPVEAIRFRMNQSGLSAKDIEPYIGSRARVSEVLSGKRKLSVDMMRALHDGLGIPYEALMQKERPASVSEIEVTQPVLKRLADFDITLSEASVGEFIDNAFGASLRPVLNRKTRTQRASGKTDANALILWQAVVLSKARKTKPISDFHPESLNKAFLRKIAQLSSHPKGPIRALNELSKMGVSVVIFPVLPGTFLDGAVMLLDGKRPVIGLTLRHDRIDNFWFTLLHELAHLAEHYEILVRSKEPFFDELDLETEDVIENEADRLAANSLIPPAMCNGLKKKFLSTEEIKAVGEEAGVHVSVVAGRWQRDHNDYKKFSRLIVRKTVREMLNSQRSCD